MNMYVCMNLKQRDQGRGQQGAPYWADQLWVEQMASPMQNLNKASL